MANTAYLRISDYRIHKGPATAKGREGTFRILGSLHGLAAHIGARQVSSWYRVTHDPLKVSLELCASTPTFIQALIRDSILPKVELEFWRDTPTGREEKFYSISLDNATLCGYEFTMKNSRDPETAADPELFEVAFRYQALTWLHDAGYIFAYVELQKGASSFAREMNKAEHLGPVK